MLARYLEGAENHELKKKTKKQIQWWNCLEREEGSFEHM
jgi:hypothetical protein